MEMLRLISRWFDRFISGLIQLTISPVFVLSQKAHDMKVGY
jgi:hypothetical protein